MKKNDNNEEINIDELNIEECFSEIEKMIDELNEDNLSLEDSFEVYNKAVKYVKLCNDKIDRVEKKIKIIEESAL